MAAVRWVAAIAFAALSVCLVLVLTRLFGGHNNWFDLDLDLVPIYVPIAALCSVVAPVRAYRRNRSPHELAAALVAGVPLATVVVLAVLLIFFRGPSWGG